jgi:hypothetical protein
MFHHVVNVLAVALIVTFAGYAVHEVVRIKECANECDARDTRHLTLLKSDVCKSRDPDKYGKEPVENCYKAERERRLAHWECTARMVWQTSEVHRLYSSVVEQQLMVFGLCGMVVWAVVHYAFQSCQSRRMEALYRETLQRVGTPATTTAQQPLQLQQQLQGIRFDFDDMDCTPRRLVAGKRRRQSHAFEFAKPVVGKIGGAV